VATVGNVARHRRSRRPRPGFLSPAARRLVADHHVDPATIAGTGVGGRVTRLDVLERVEGSPGNEVVALNRVQRITGEHMRRSLDVAPHAFVSMEVDFQRVDQARQVAQLKYLPFIARALVDAIADFPNINASVDDGALVVHHEVHLGIAVDLDHQGLIVPVVRDAHTKRLTALATEIGNRAARARARQLAPDDVTGGTFTITNPGPFGTTVSAPIIHQPQVAILSTDGVRRRPMVVELADGTEAITVRSVGMLGLSFDHRAVDGAYASAFLARVRERLETRDWVAEL
jgi:pyruvate dehydrogenase E2 component (dihydrolipoamide acetyltransferase)